MKFNNFGKSGRVSDMDGGQWGLLFIASEERELILRLAESKLPSGETGQFAVVFQKSKDEKNWFIARVIGQDNGLFRRPVWILPDEAEFYAEYDSARPAEYLSCDRQATLVVSKGGQVFCQVPFVGWLNLNSGTFSHDDISPADSLVEFPRWFIRVGDKHEIYATTVYGEAHYLSDP
ncbi:MAG: hypothetical protein VYC38_06955 [Pseudomonadota bacterium]|nr:hypothetical protein [Pseudomonadota bacterium]